MRGKANTVAAFKLLTAHAGSFKLSDEITSWHGDCTCGATATTGMTRTVCRYDAATKAYKVVATYYPGPSCDACGKPWKQE